MKRQQRPVIVIPYPEIFQYYHNHFIRLIPVWIPENTKKKSKSLKIPNSIWTMLKAFIDFCVKGIIDDVETQSVAYLFCGNDDIRIIGIVF